MSNYKSNLQINNESISANNIDLQTLIDQVNALPDVGGVELPELINPATKTEILSGYEAIDENGNVITGNIPTKTSSDLVANGATVTIPSGYYASQATKYVSTATQAIPSISVDGSGLITASTTQSAGYVNAGTKSATKQLTIQAAKTITPTKSSQTAVTSGVYTTGNIIVNPIPNEYVDVSSATATEDTVFAGQTFGANGEELKTGTFTIDGELTAQDDLITQIQTALQNKASATPIEPVLQNKNVTPTTSSQVVSYDDGFDGLNQVTVEAIPSNYIIPSGTSTITTNGTYDVKNYAFAVVNVEGGSSGGDSNETLDSLMAGTISSYTNNTMSEVRAGLFMKCSNLSNISFSACTTIKQAAFSECSKLATVSFPACTKVEDNAFFLCSKITSVSFPVCTSIGSGAFARCSGLTEVNMPECTIAYISAFASCAKLQSINFPNCTSVYNYAFNTCSLLTDVSMPAVTTLLNSAFSNCYALSTISLPAASSIAAGVFMKCYNLKSLYLMGSSVCKLSNSNTFTSTPIGGYSTSAGTYGSIFVPASLLTSYKTATNWTYFSSRIVGV